MTELKKTLTIEFAADRDGERSLRRTLNADTTYAALWDIQLEVFRPARKHGYIDPEIQSALDKAGDGGAELVRLLEKKVHEILNEHGINMGDWS